MDYYSYVSQRHAVSPLDSTAPSDYDVGSSLRFSLSGGGGAGARYSGGVLAHCGASSTFSGQHHQLGGGGPRLEGSTAIANGELSPRAAPGRAGDSAGYGRPSTSVQDDGDNHRHAELTTSTSLPHRLRYLPPPPGSVLPPSLDVEQDDENAAAGDGRSSAGSSTHSSTSGGLRHPSAATPRVDHQTQIKIDAEEDSGVSTEKSEQASTNAAAAADASAASGLTSSQPLIYPWMRRIHSSNNGIYVMLSDVIIR